MIDQSAQQTSQLLSWLVNQVKVSRNLLTKESPGHYSAGALDKPGEKICCERLVSALSCWWDTVVNGLSWY